jgi:DNA-directed RNA polymerase I and III subunit RPAC1
MGTNEVTRIVTDEEKREAKNFNIFDLPDVPTGLPPHLELQRTRVVCKKDSNIHVSTILDQNLHSF